MTLSTLLTLSGAQIREMFSAGAAWLERHKEQINAINVFPVPDGDTGTNMSLTLRSTLEETANCPDLGGAGQVLQAMSHGALMGARGNSGVILSQIILGMARAAPQAESLDPEDLVSALEAGAEGAYAAVTCPAEGTILTVVRDAASGGRHRLLKGGAGIVEVVEAMTSAARESVDRTPSLLPALAEAGVVDAGGQGLYVWLEGILRYLKGEPLDVAPLEQEARVGREWLTVRERLHGGEESLYGYCTEVLIEGSRLQPEVIKEEVIALGDSVLVVGDERLVRVHVHTDRPGSVLNIGTAAGSLVQVKVDNIQRQADRFLESHSAHAEAERISTVAVASGRGLAEVFLSVGCSRVVSGGPTMNPSTREIAVAIEACSCDDVIVLPNDKNIVMAAEQAVSLTGKRVRVLPTRSIPQGLAALLALSQESEVEANLQAMEEAMTRVRTVEVTRAVRSTSVGGVAVREGDAIAIVDDKLKLTAASLAEAAEAAVRAIAKKDTSLITLYYGADTAEGEAAALADRFRQAHPNHEVEVVYGGQPHYQYIVGME